MHREGAGVSVHVFQGRDSESPTGAVAIEMKNMGEQFKRHFSGLIHESTCVIGRVWENLGITAKLHGS